MPVTVGGATSILIPNLVSSVMLGTRVPQYSRGVANGLVKWIPMVKAHTKDIGTSGAWKSAPTPVTIPNPLMYTSVITGMRSQGFKGTAMPLFSAGLANGLVATFATAMINTTHPSVGAGSGIAKFSAPSAASPMVLGFLEAGMSGEFTIKMARAVARALDLVFASLVVPFVIVGPSSPNSGAGSGFGGIR
jgi:hypothetical protein